MNEQLSSSSSITSENVPTNSGNTSLINWTDFNVNGNTLKNSAETLDNSPPLSQNLNTPILVKDGQSNIELQALKNYILKIQASALKSLVKCELSTLANITETMSLNLWKAVNAQQKM